VMATNPAVSLPRANYVREALKQLDLFVVSENVLANDTVTAGAHVLLPAAAWGEKDGTVTNSERRISRQRQFLPLPGEAKPDWWIVTEIARQMGFASAFAYESAADIFREHATLSAFENDGGRDFDLGALAAISDRAFDQLDPVQWPLRSGEMPHNDRRFFMRGGFYTPDRKARFVAVEPPAPKVATSRQFPFRLNTGRVRDQWHTMTRSGQSARLATHRPEPFVEVHPADAKAMKLADGGFASVATRWGACVLRVVIGEEQRRGSLFAPIHWSDATASAARVGDLVMPETDRYSGQPDAKATPASIAPVEFAFRGFALTRRPIGAPHGAWWARVAVAGASGLLLATNDGPEIWQSRAREMLGGELAEYVDRQRGIYRAASFTAGELKGCLFIGAAATAPQWDAVKALFAAEALSEEARRVLLSGRSADGLVSAGPIVCACFSVGLATIRAAIEAGAAASIEGIGEALRAGTNCGSCLPELKRLISEAGIKPAATPSQAFKPTARGRRGEPAAARTKTLAETDL
jgi:assimilatory nitrate reductase catalytic subunit